MMKKWIVGILVLAVVLAGWRIGARWHVLNKLYSNSKVNHRVAIVPTELDLSKVQVVQGVTCNVGYAEFIIPSTNLVQLNSSGSDCAVVGVTDNLGLIFMVPFDPSSPDKPAADFKNDLIKIPNDHLLRQKLAKAGSTFLDFEISAEQITPPTFWKTVFQNSKLFAFHTLLLSMKAETTGMGMRSVHTYQTPETRGLIRLGEHPDDTSNAHVVIENRAGTQAVGIHIFARNGNTNSIMDMLPIILATFRFTLKNLNSPDHVKQAIIGAGILPMEEQKTSPTNPSTAPE